MLARTRSNFSKVGVSLLLAHVYCLPVSSISFKFKLSIIALNIKDQRELKLLLFFSSGLRIILKSPPTNIGNDSFSQILASSAKKAGFCASCAAPYTDTNTQSKPSPFDLTE